MHIKIAANAAAIRRWLASTEQTLANHSDRLNAINIFPVADGDTGSNLYLTARAARLASENSGENDLGKLLADASLAAMEQARGNSGTLFSVFLSAIGEPVRGQSRWSGSLLAMSLNRAQIRLWSALTDPQPGTMISVIDAAASAAALVDAANNGDESNKALAQVLDAAVEGALEAVVNSESQLGILREAKVVDAGAVGMLLVLDCLRSSILGIPIQSDLFEGLNGYNVADPHIHGAHEHVDGVEVMCTISLTPLDAAGLRVQLTECGDSVILTPITENANEAGEYRWRVHVHVLEQEPALNLLRSIGTPVNITITALDGSELHNSDSENSHRLHQSDCQIHSEKSVISQLSNAQSQ